MGEACLLLRRGVQNSQAPLLIVRVDLMPPPSFSLPLPLSLLLSLPFSLSLPLSLSPFFLNHSLLSLSVFPALCDNCVSHPYGVTSAAFGSSVQVLSLILPLHQAHIYSLIFILTPHQRNHAFHHSLTRPLPSLYDICLCSHSSLVNSLSLTLSRRDRGLALILTT